MATKTPKSSRRMLPFFIYLLSFFGFWIVWVLAIYPQLIKLGERTLLYAIVNLTLRFIVWVLPVLLYLRYIDRIDPIEYLKLRQNWKIGIAFGFAFAALDLVVNVVAHGPPRFNLEAVSWNSILGTSFLIGFIEEVPFRGFILQKFGERMNFWAANIVSSILFLLIHLPGWISLHLWDVRHAITVLVIGIVMAVLFRFSRSLWSSITAHSAHDCISVLLTFRA